MGRCFIFVLTLAVAGSASHARPLRPSEFGQICADDIDRFCPSLGGTIETRNQRICLKPYRNSLARSCRAAMMKLH